jgi:hypothetical protein
LLPAAMADKCVSVATTAHVNFVFIQPLGVDSRVAGYPARRRSCWLLFICKNIFVILICCDPT